MKAIGPDYIDYWQSVCPAQRGLTSTFGIRVRDGCCSAVNSVSGGQSNTFGRPYQIPVQPESLPSYLRLIIDNHVLNCQTSDLMDVLSGQKSFQDALVAPAQSAAQPEAGEPGKMGLPNTS